MREKVFYNIAELTEKLNAQEQQFLKIASGPEESRNVHLRLLLWQVRANLAIAQQLSVISGHLGAIVSKSKEP